MLLAVDLASRMWAACLGEEGQCVNQFSAINFKTEDAAVDALTHLFRPESIRRPEWLLLEDVPYGTLPNTSSKDVIRFQGRIVERMKHYEEINRLLFVQPMEWQRYFKVNQGNTTQRSRLIAQVADESFGYKAPNLIVRHRELLMSKTGKDRSNIRTTLNKLMTDHTAAFMIYRWAHEVGEEKMLASKSVQRYER